LRGILLLLFTSALWAQDKPPRSPSPYPHTKASAVDTGALRDGVYRNSGLGFSYKLPYGWVDRTADIQDDSAASKSRVLLAVFERPPEVTGDTINSAAVIAAEPLAASMKTATDYFESLAALTSNEGFQTAQDPQEISVGATKLLRGDFSKARGKLTMHQTSLVLVEKGYAVSFTFIAGSADELNELIERLRFAARKSLR
jgi:hypothetical protein